jgi:hypothetical protein
MSEEETCSTCGKTWDDPDGRFCSNLFHLAAPRVKQQLIEYFNEVKSLRDQLAAKDRDIELYKKVAEVQNNKIIEWQQFEKRVNNDLAAERNKVKDLKKALKDVLPIAENHASILRIDEEYSGDDMGYKESQLLIDKAKNLLK